MTSVVLILQALALLQCLQLTTSHPLPSDCGQTPIPPSASNGKMRIVGGLAAIPYSWPWQVQIRYNNQHHCGASILTNDWIVTAAHCVKGYSTSKMSIRAGRYLKAIENGTHEQVSPVSQVIIHKKFVSSTLDNDIALIQLGHPFEWNSEVGPVCLTSAGTEDPAAGTMMYVTGWGDVQGTCCADLLKQASVPIMDREICNEPDYHDGWITENMLCAGYEMGGVDACQGDSGGPLVHKTDVAWELVGVVSWGGDVCAEARKPGVYAKVANYIDWITTYVK